MTDFEKNEYSIFLTTCAEKEKARLLAEMLVEKRLAACVQMFPAESVYAWQGEICADGEIVMFIKSKTAQSDKIADAVKENHEYEVPELIRIPVTGGLPEYMKWMDENVD
ncbi:MAG: divalent-cation tolerance protein CutA [Oscillospiraceae bacterium]|nr:divalent-cation tolerance protein CutA [Oscillospiraceae bacterium]